MDEREEVVEQISPEMERTVDQRARDRAGAARWDLDVAIFLFGILAILIILLFQGIGIAIVAPVAVFGLAMVWLVGWRRARQLYPRFLNEEIYRLEQELKRVARTTVTEAMEETIEEKVQRALRERGG